MAISLDTSTAGPGAITAKGGWYRIETATIMVVIANAPPARTARGAVGAPTGLGIAFGGTARARSRGDTSGGRPAGAWRQTPDRRGPTRARGAARGPPPRPPPP